MVRGPAAVLIGPALALAYLVGASWLPDADAGRADQILGAALLALAVVAVLWPYVIALPLALVGAWLAVGLLGKARALSRAARLAEPDLRNGGDG